MKGNHGDPIVCESCKSESVQPVSVEGADSQFSFALTRRRDGTVVDPPFLGTIQLVRCAACDYEFALIDTPKSSEHWSQLPKWEGQQPN